MSLDDTLDAILDSARYRMARHSVLKAEIMQALRDEGYMCPVDAFGNKLMIGQEYFDRFLYEYARLAKPSDTYPITEDNLAVQAAKRAAGIEDKNEQ